MSDKVKFFDEIKPVFFIDSKMNNILNDIIWRCILMYKTIVIGYYPKASTMAKKVEEKK